MQRTAEVDRVIESVTSFFPYGGELFFTLSAPDGQLFTNWSRNLNSYREIEGLPLVIKARASGGFTVWESFSPPFIHEQQRDNRSFISLARLIDSGPGSPQSLLVMSFRTDLLARILQEGRAGTDVGLVLCDETGKAYIGTPTGLSASQDLSALVEGRTTADGRVMERRDLRSVPGDLAGGGLLLLALYESDDLDKTARPLLLTLSAFFALLMVTMVVMTWFISRRIVDPLDRLAAQMKGWEPGGAIPAGLLLPRRDEIGRLQTAFVAMNARIEELFLAVENEHKVREHYRFVSQQAQLNPHFLFNSLNTLRFMAIIGKVPNMVEAIDAVGTVLQHSLGRDTGNTTVGEELRSLESLVKVYNLRFGDAYSLQVVYIGDQSDLESLPMVRFILYPAVENSILHGYEGQTGTGKIRVTVARETRVPGTETLVITVQDWGAGIPPARLATIFDESPRGQGIGLHNIREMIRLVHGEAGTLTVQSTPGEGTVVTYRFPAGGPA